jgi:hypothetical protein
MSRTVIVSVVSDRVIAATSMTLSRYSANEIFEELLAQGPAIPGWRKGDPKKKERESDIYDQDVISGSGKTWTIDSFEESIDEIYPPEDIEAREAAVELVTALRCHADTQPFLSFLNLELIEGKQIGWVQWPTE